jgi:hypothetical protein
LNRVKITKDTRINDRGFSAGEVGEVLKIDENCCGMEEYLVKTETGTWWVEKKDCIYIGHLNIVE